eukprot:1664279-Amphidinium_carterae.1
MAQEHLVRAASSAIPSASMRQALQALHRVKAAVLYRSCKKQHTLAIDKGVPIESSIWWRMPSRERLSAQQGLQNFEFKC